MHYLKARLFAVVLILIGAGLVYYNWRELWQEHEYSMKIAAFAPLCVVGALFLLIFPTTLCINIPSDAYGRTAPGH